MPGATSASSKYVRPPLTVPIGVKPKPHPSVLRRMRYCVAPGEAVQLSWTGALLSQADQRGGGDGRRAAGRLVGGIEGGAAGDRVQIEGLEEDPGVRRAVGEVAVVVVDEAVGGEPVVDAAAVGRPRRGGSRGGVGGDGQVPRQVPEPVHVLPARDLRRALGDRVDVPAELEGDQLLGEVPVGLRRDQRLAVAAVVERARAPVDPRVRRSCRSSTGRWCAFEAPAIMVFQRAGVPASGGFAGGFGARARSVGGVAGIRRRARSPPPCRDSRTACSRGRGSPCRAPSPCRSRRGSPSGVRRRSSRRTPGPTQECCPCSSAKVSPIASPVADSGAVPVASFWSRPWPNSCRKTSGISPVLLQPRPGVSLHEVQASPSSPARRRCRPAGG